jgi:hypothetical protein
VVRPNKTDAEDPAWRQQLDALAERVWAWTGNQAGIAELSESDLPRLLKERPSVLKAVEEEGIDLAGMPRRKWIKGPS